MNIRITKPLRESPWRVDCDHCQGQWPLFLQPWAFAVTWETAMVMARWHVQLHREQTCPHCGQIPQLPYLKVLSSPGLFQMGDDLYQLGRSGQVHKVVPA